MNSKLTQISVFAAAFLGLGLSMPSCPGQQAMQQQIDTMQASQGLFTKQFQSLNEKFKKTEEDNTAIKGQLTGMQTALDDMGKKLIEIESASKSSPKSSGKAKHK